MGNSSASQTDSLDFSLEKYEHDIKHNLNIKTIKAYCENYIKNIEQNKYPILSFHKDVLYILGLIYFIEPDFCKALDYLTKAYTLGQKKSASFIGILHWRGEKKFYEDRKWAIDYMKRFRKCNLPYYATSNYPDRYYISDEIINKIDKLMKSKNIDENHNADKSLQFLCEAIDNKTDNPEVYLCLGGFYYTSKDYESTMKYFIMARDLGSDYMANEKILGLYLRKECDPNSEDAIKCLNECIKLKVHDINTRCSQLYELREDYELAIKYMELIIDEKYHCKAKFYTKLSSLVAKKEYKHLADENKKLQKQLNDINGPIINTKLPVLTTNSSSGVLPYLNSSNSHKQIYSNVVDSPLVATKPENVMPIAYATPFIDNYNDTAPLLTPYTPSAPSLIYE